MSRAAERTHAQQVAFVTYKELKAEWGGGWRLLGDTQRGSLIADKAMGIALANEPDFGGEERSGSLSFVCTVYREMRALAMGEGLL